MKIESGRGVQGEMLKCVVMMLSVVFGRDDVEMSSEGHEKSKMFEKRSVEHENRKREGGAGGRVQC